MYNTMNWIISVNRAYQVVLRTNLFLFLRGMGRGMGGVKYILFCYHIFVYQICILLDMKSNSIASLRSRCFNISAQKLSKQYVLIIICKHKCINKIFEIFTQIKLTICMKITKHRRITQSMYKKQDKKMVSFLCLV